MSHETLTFARASLRGSDSNSLLRLYDLASEIFSRSRSQVERDRAGKAIQRIAQELRKRNVKT
jgi:hypothetical protein